MQHIDEKILESFRKYLKDNTESSNLLHFDFIDHFGFVEVSVDVDVSVWVKRSRWIGGTDEFGWDEIIESISSRSVELSNPEFCMDGVLNNSMLERLLPKMEEVAEEFNL